MGIIHFDMKPENVLLDKIYNHSNNNYFTLPTAKISDFGTSLFNKLNASFLNDIDYTLRYSAPERIGNNCHINNWKLCDVFSFGMTIYSVMLGHYPFNNVKDDCEVTKFIVNGHLPDEYESIVDEELKILFIRCCIKEQKYRPMIKHVLIDLERMKSRKTYCPYTNK